MTSEQFVAMYEGHEVKVNAMYGVGDPLVNNSDKQKYIGKCGIVKGIECSADRSFVSVFIDDRAQVFLPHELDLIKRTVSSLPLPG